MAQSACSEKHVWHKLYCCVTSLFSAHYEDLIERQHSDVHQIDQEENLMLPTHIAYERCVSKQNDAIRPHTNQVPMTIIVSGIQHLCPSLWLKYPQLYECKQPMFNSVFNQSVRKLCSSYQGKHMHNFPTAI